AQLRQESGVVGQKAEVPGLTPDIKFLVLFAKINHVVGDHPESAASAGESQGALSGLAWSAENESPISERHRGAMNVGMGTCLALSQQGEGQAFQKGVAEKGSVASHRWSQESCRMPFFKISDGSVLASDRDIENISLASENRVGPGRNLIESIVHQESDYDLSVS